MPSEAGTHTFLPRARAIVLRRANARHPDALISPAHVISVTTGKTRARVYVRPVNKRPTPSQVLITTHLSTMKAPHRPTGFVGLSRQRQACACSRRRSPQRRSSPCRRPEAGALRMGASSSMRVHRGPRRDRERSRLLWATGVLAAAAAAARRDRRMAERFNGAAERLSAYAPRGRHPSNTTTSGMGKQQPVQQAQLPGDLEKHGDGRMGESTASKSK